MTFIAPAPKDLLVHEDEVTGAAVTTLTVTGLDLDADLEYIAELEITPGANGLVYVFANNLTTATDYSSQETQSGGTGTPSATRYNAPKCGVTGVAGANSKIIMEIGYATGRFFGVHYRQAQSIGTGANNVTTWRGGMGKTAALAANLTRLDFTCTVANGFGVGTKLRIYKRN